MRKFQISSAAAAIALGVGLCTLASADAGATPVPLVNGNFSTDLSGWTSTPFVGPGANVGIFWSADVYPGDNVRGITSTAVMNCGHICPSTGSNVLSQTVNSLVTGHRYQITFYTVGLNSGSYPLSAPGPLYVQLGSAISDPIAVPYITDGAIPVPSGRVSWTFTYTDPGSSATLSLIERFSGLNMGVPPCVPCLTGGEQVDISNVSLEDIDGGGGGGGGGGGTTSEPSTLATLGLGIGALGLYWRRRRENAVT